MLGANSGARRFVLGGRVTLELLGGVTDGLCGNLTRCVVFFAVIIAEIGTRAADSRKLNLVRFVEHCL